MSNLHEFDDWQQEILEYEGDIGLAKGRKIGATWLFSVKAVEHLKKHYNTHPTSQIICVSVTEDQAELVIAFALQYAQEKYPYLIARGVDRPTKTKLVLDVDGNKRILLARPKGSSADSTRGYECQVLMIDEAAFHDRRFFASATPNIMSKGGNIWMWSTFNDKDGYFWDQYKQAAIDQDPDARFKFWVKNTEEVFHNRKMSSTWTEELKARVLRALDREKKSMTEAEYALEYLAIPTDDIRRWFNDDDLDMMCTLQAIPETIGRKVYFGSDIARMGEDETTYEGINKRSEEDYTQIHHEVSLKQKIDWIFDRIIQIILAFKPLKYAIDGRGLGAGLYDFLMKHKKARNVITNIDNAELVVDANGEKTKKTMKEEMYTIWKILARRGYIHLLDRPDIRSSLASIQYEYVRKAGQESRLRITSKYGHIAEGLGRAILEAYLDKSLKPFVTSSNSQKIF